MGRMRRRVGVRRSLSALTCVGVLLAAGCQSSDKADGGDASGPFQSPGQGPDTGIVNANVAHTTDWSFGDYSGCFPGTPVPIELKSMELLSPTGKVRIALTGVKVDDGRSGVSVMPGALPTGFGSLRTITQAEADRMRCDGGDLVAQVAVTVSSTVHWEAKGMRLSYQAEGKSYIVDWKVRIVNCAPRGDTSEVCIKGTP